MIGFYNYTVILTYLSLVCSVVGISFAVSGNIFVAIICLLISGCCDMFDGRIARSKKDRSKDEENFGMEIDSLCDLVCFTAFPAVIAYCLGGFKPLAIFSGALLVLCGVIRLAYFNVLEIKRKNEAPDSPTEYRGLPVTTAALIFPAVYLFKDVCGDAFPTVFHASLIITAILYVINFRIKKPGTKGVIAMAAAGVVIAAIATVIHVI